MRCIKSVPIWLTLNKKLLGLHHMSDRLLKQGRSISLSCVLVKYQKWLPYTGQVLLLLRPCWTENLTQTLARTNRSTTNASHVSSIKSFTVGLT